MTSFILCRLLIFCGLVLGISLLWSGAAINAADAASAPGEAVEESEPNDVGGVLEFRIAPQQAGSRPRPGPLKAEEIAQYRKDLTANGPSAAIERDDEFVWMEIMKGVKLPENLITEEYRGAEYLLVHNWPPFVMSSEMGWGLQSVSKDTKDNMGRAAVGFQFNRDGADRFSYLTSANIDQALAIIVEGKVVSAPHISTAVRSQAVITGEFTGEQLDDMIKALRRIVRPISNTAPASVQTRSVLRTFLIPVLFFVLAVSVVGFFVYR